MPIEFPKGASSASVRGRLSGRQQALYALKVREGQVITLELNTTPAGGLELKLHDPRGGETTLRQLNPHGWTAAAQQTGEYVITVIRTSDRPEASTYKLAVAVH